MLFIPFFSYKEHFYNNQSNITIFCVLNFQNILILLTLFTYILHICKLFCIIIFITTIIFVILIIIAVIPPLYHLPSFRRCHNETRDWPQYLCRHCKPSSDGVPIVCLLVHVQNAAFPVFLGHQPVSACFTHWLEGMCTLCMLENVGFPVCGLLLLYYHPGWNFKFKTWTNLGMFKF